MTEQKYNRWSILIATIIVNICIGTLYAWSIFALPLGNLFGWTAAVTALAFTICHGLSPVAVISGGYIQDKFGGRASILIGGSMYVVGMFLSGFVTSIGMLYFAYSVLAGIGGGIAYAGTVGNTVKFFPDKRGLAAGLVTAGYGSGAMIVAPIANALIENYGVLSTFKILGVTFLVIIAICLLIIKRAPADYKPDGWEPPIVAGVTKKAVMEVNWVQMIVDKTWWVVLLILIFGAMSGLMFISAVSQIGQTMFGLTAMTAALFVSLIAVANSAGRIFFGAISDKVGTANTLMIMYIVSALCLLLCATTQSTIGLAISVIGIGAGFGGFMGTFPSIISGRYGLKNFGVNFGVTFIGFSISAVCGPMLGAMIAMKTGSYQNALWIILGLNFVGLLFAALFKRLDRPSHIVTSNSIAK